MKTIKTISLVLGILLLASSCGVNSALYVNHNQNATQVHLTGNNYKFVRQVSGSAVQEYILLIGGMVETKLYQNAYANMLKDAGLADGSRALINVVTEEHNGGMFPFYYRKTITFTGQVIEFTR